MHLPNIHSSRSFPFTEYLTLNGFEVETLEDSIFRVVRDSELPVYISITEESLFFEVDAGSIANIASAELYKELLELNTEILPVSFGIDDTGEGPRLLLVESRVFGDLSENELLSVFTALELAVDRAEALLSKYLNA